MDRIENGRGAASIDGSRRGVCDCNRSRGRATSRIRPLMDKGGCIRVDWFAHARCRHGSKPGVRPGLEIEVEFWVRVSNKDEMFSYPIT